MWVDAELLLLCREDLILHNMASPLLMGTFYFISGLFGVGWPLASRNSSTVNMAFLCCNLLHRAFIAVAESQGCWVMGFICCQLDFWKGERLPFLLLCGPFLCVFASSRSLLACSFPLCLGASCVPHIVLGAVIISASWRVAFWWREDRQGTWEQLFILFF